MDTTRFTDSKTGTLVPIQIPRLEKPDSAFIPGELLRSWSLPNTLWPLLADAKQALGTLDGIGRTLPNPDLLMQPLQHREALRSSSLEGTYATPAELLLFELEPKEPESETDRVNVWKEVANYRRALLEGAAFLMENPISNSLIKLLHHRLLEGVRGADKSPGQFRDKQVYIGASRRYIPPPPLHLSGLLDDLEDALRNPSGDIDPLVFSYLIHYQFEAIHPFTDGNGRVGRLLLALTSWRWCGLSLPWLYMSAFYEQHKDDYIDTMFNVSARGEWSEWVELCLRGTIDQCNDSIRRCEALGNLRSVMHDRITDASPRTHQQVEELFSRPVCTVPTIRDRYDVSYPTARADIDKLIAAGILKKIPDTTHPTVFMAPEIYDIAYS